VRKVTGGIINTIVEGLSRPAAVAVDAQGNLYIADTGNHRVLRVDQVTGVITTVAGTGTEGYSGDGGAPTSAALSNPAGLAFDAAGNLFISDTGNDVIRKVTLH
jgi:sugar lactone lactonase YvrE